MATYAGADGAHTRADGARPNLQADDAAICEPCAGADAAPLAVAEPSAWRPDAAARSQPDAEA